MVGWILGEVAHAFEGTGSEGLLEKWDGVLSGGYRVDTMDLALECDRWSASLEMLS